VNAKKLELHSEEYRGTEAMAQRRFSAGQSHLCASQPHASTADEFDKDVAADEPELKLLMGRRTGVGSGIHICGKAKLWKSAMPCANI